MEGTLAQVILFAGNFAPRNWAFCQGQLLPIAQNQALFSLLGTIYGGDGRTTFALPDLQSRVPVGVGTGPGLSTISQGERGGRETVTLTINQMPNHTHLTQVTGGIALGGGRGAVSTGNGNFLSGDTSPTAIYKPGAGGGTLNGLESLAVNVIPAGNQQPFNIRNPYLGMNYIICLAGLFPSRN